MSGGEETSAEDEGFFDWTAQAEAADATGARARSESSASSDDLPHTVQLTATLWPQAHPVHMLQVHCLSSLASAKQEVARRFRLAPDAFELELVSPTTGRPVPNPDEHPFTHAWSCRVVVNVDAANPGTSAP